MSERSKPDRFPELKSQDDINRESTLWARFLKFTMTMIYGGKPNVR